MIDKLTLQNFKAFSTLEIEFGLYALLTGVNSAGKTSVTQSIALLYQSLLEMGPHSSGEINASLILNGDYLNLGQGRDVRHENWDSSIDPDGHVVVGMSAGAAFTRIEASYLADSDVLPARVTQSGQKTGLFACEPGMFQYISADRIAPSTSYPRSYGEVVTRRRLGTRGEYAVNYLSEFQDDAIASHLRGHASQASQLLLPQVEAWLGEVQPGLAIEVSNFAGLDSARLAFKAGRAGIQSSNSYRPTHVGFGISFALPVIVACLATPVGGTIIVENPESHLHPRAQTALGSLLAKTAASGTQVIVESHSDHILNSLRYEVKSETLSSDEASIHFFSRSPDGISVSTPGIRPNGRIDSWPTGFFDEWESTTMRLLE